MSACRLINECDLVYKLRERIEELESAVTDLKIEKEELEKTICHLEDCYSV